MVLSTVHTTWMPSASAVATMPVGAAGVGRMCPFHTRVTVTQSDTAPPWETLRACMVYPVSRSTSVLSKVHLVAPASRLLYRHAPGVSDGLHLISVYASGVFMCALANRRCTVRPQGWSTHCPCR